MMELRVAEEAVFPEPVQELLQTLYGVGFFGDSMLVGSWVMPLYRRLFGIAYPLRTLDIDSAVQLTSACSSGRTDLEATLLALGYLPSTSRSGVQRFTRKNGRTGGLPPVRKKAATRRGHLHGIA